MLRGFDSIGICTRALLRLVQQIGFHYGDSPSAHETFVQVYARIHSTGKMNLSDVSR
jgi:hypothetical protein